MYIWFKPSTGMSVCLNPCPTKMHDSVVQQPTQKQQHKNKYTAYIYIYIYIYCYGCHLYWIFLFTCFDFLTTVKMKCGQYFQQVAKNQGIFKDFCFQGVRPSILYSIGLVFTLIAAALDCIEPVWSSYQTHRTCINPYSHRIGPICSPFNARTCWRTPQEIIMWCM